MKLSAISFSGEPIAIVRVILGSAVQQKNRIGRQFAIGLGCRLVVHDCSVRAEGGNRFKTVGIKKFSGSAEFVQFSDNIQFIAALPVVFQPVKELYDGDGIPAVGVFHS